MLHPPAESACRLPPALDGDTSAGSSVLLHPGELLQDCKVLSSVFNYWYFYSCVSRLCYSKFYGVKVTDLYLR
jgi:hypothetical protein